MRVQVHPFFKDNRTGFLFPCQFPSEDKRKDTRATELSEKVFKWHTCSSLYESPVDGDSAFRFSASVEDEVAMESIKYHKHSNRLFAESHFLNGYEC